MEYVCKYFHFGNVIYTDRNIVNFARVVTKCRNILRMTINVLKCVRCLLFLRYEFNMIFMIVFKKIGMISISWPSPAYIVNFFVQILRQ